MTSGFNYYVHESGCDGLFTVCIHRSDCIHCNEGRGQVAGSLLRWTSAEAVGRPQSC